MERVIIDHLTVQVGDKILLGDICLDLDLTQSNILIGESGSGKTLLTKLLLGTAPPAAQIRGKILYKGQNLLSLAPKEWQTLRGCELAYLVQNSMAMYNPFQTIQQHFLETILSHKKISKAAALDLALKSMKEVRLGHIDSLLGKYPFELSGGQLQRLMLAMLLCLEPKTLILDEPTSALDAYNRDNILRILKILQDKGVSLITVTHDYDLARALGGQVTVLYRGQVVEVGAIEAVLTSPQHPYTQELVLKNPYERLVKDDASM